MFSAGFRPFFLLAGIWAAVAVPLWLAAYSAGLVLPGVLPPTTWHAHDMVFGFAFAAAAGFLLTAIPNWTGRLPLGGAPLAALVALWFAGRAALLLSARIGPAAAAAIDLAFPVALVAVVAREILAGRNWRNLPMVGALALLFTGSLLVHLEALGMAGTAALGNRIGIGTFLMLIALIGGRIVPSFTRNWLARMRPGGALPASKGRLDAAALAITVAALGAWVAAPESSTARALCFAASVALAVRLVRWRGWATLREPLLFILHVGYAWLPAGLLLVAAQAFLPRLPASAALHALTVGAIGTMTLAVMTRASRGHSGRPLTADWPTGFIYVLVTAAAVLRVSAPLAGADYLAHARAAGAAWSAAFLLFALSYGRILLNLPPKTTQGPDKP